MKRCELCDSLAKLYCESNEANLCWQCDTYVHRANLLAAKLELVPTVSGCSSDCVSNFSCKEERSSEGDQVGDNIDVDEEEYDNEKDNGVYDADGEDTEEKVVPWSSTRPPDGTSFSNTEESPCRLSDTDGGISQSRTVFSSKRKRGTVPESTDSESQLYERRLMRVQYCSSRLMLILMTKSFLAGLSDFKLKSEDCNERSHSFSSEAGSYRLGCLFLLYNQLNVLMSSESAYKCM
ncbi:hypothetical protein NC653_010357 [Populus alba x Populus x berolinensis]|uniref:B box-type domain-containing protein n=1 Tax=Populus alba x Populus x berolinensis TaxID=444605 RepID=A0AAD6R0Q5_9ROSI|nr:hypothetical protein NC653_010357 [Populus alba x Populus x berolinensis]